MLDADPVALRHAYAAAPFLQKFLAVHRTAICPFTRLYPHLPTAANLLDIGCGVGSWLMHLALANKIAHGTGIDVNDNAIIIARQAAARWRDTQTQSPTLQFLASKKFSDWPQKLFDCVTLIDVLHHVPPATLPEFITAATTRLRLGGVLLIKDMAARPLYANWWNRLHDLLLARQWINYVRREQLPLAAPAFTLRSEENFQVGPYAHVLWVWQKTA
jgi:2-polyprenyl-3-methyl-5-hydroxy-6-metoxy-1,4-benzoquinol methylase